MQISGLVLISLTGDISNCQVKRVSFWLLRVMYGILTFVYTFVGYCMLLL
jgi:hypothetical protein